ncbi:MAG: T9SS type A sorting domain-containing protein, partial [Candidatus Eisenbacteria bacterium]|nr:T9SS type A sorting domain-containing protein [Candidatus Eisenbacteria bacterium]
IVQFTDVPIAFAVAGGEYTFQVILDGDGTITFQYLDMEGLLTGATIGIENTDGSIGLQVACNEPYVHNALAVEIGLGGPGPAWLYMEPMQGELDPGEEAEVACCVDCAGLDPGIYECELTVTSNDYNNPNSYVTLTAQVFPTGIDGASTAQVALKGNYPNPFNPRTMIAYDLPRPSRVSMRVYNMAGRLVRTLLENASRPGGRNAEPWDGRTDSGEAVTSGVYFCRLEVDGKALTGKMVLIK